MKLSEYLKNNNMTTKEYFDMQKRRSKGVTTLTDYRRNKKNQLSNAIGFDTLESDLSSMGTTIKGIYDGWQTQETMNNTKSSIESMYNRLASLQQYNKTFGVTDGEKNLAETVNAYKTTLDKWDDLTTHYGMYENEKAFNKAKKAEEKKAKEKEGMKTADLGLVQSEIDDLNEQITALQKQKKSSKKNYYGSKNADELIAEMQADPEADAGDAWFKSDVEYKNKIEKLQKAKNEKESYLKEAQEIQENIKFTEIATSGGGKEGYNKWLEDVEKAKAQKAKEEAESPVPKWLETAIGNIGGSNSDFGEVITDTIELKQEDTSYQLPKTSWTEEERYEFGARYLEDPQKAYDYAANLNNSKNIKEKNKKKGKIEDSATSGFLGGLVHSLGAIISAPTGFVDYLDDVTDVAAGRQVIVEENIVSPFEYSQTVESGISTHLNEVSGTLDENIPILGGKGLGDVYGLGMSMAESSASAYSLGSVGTLISYFGQGAAAGVDDAVSRGATAEEALVYGLAMGAAEGIPEMVSANKLLKLGKSSNIGFLGKVRKQAREEGTEEFVTGILSNAADNAIMQDKSAFYAKVGQYEARGFSESEAKEKAWLDTAEEIAYDALAGYISGGLHAAPVAALTTKKENKFVKETYGEDVDAVITEGLASDKNSLSYKLAEKYKAKIDGGKDLSATEISRLVEANQDAIKAEIKKDAEQKLSKLNGSDNNSKIAEIIAKKSMGEELTQSEVKTLQNSEFGNRVYNEITNDDLISLAETMSEEDNNLFVSLYDETVNGNLENYQESYNLVKEYAKNDFSQDYILENRGVLSAGQVSAIYKAKVLNSDTKLEKAIKILKEKHKGSTFIEGTIDDSVINYENTKIEGKVNWDSLDSKQQKAIVVLSAFGKRAGMDVELISDGIERKINGAFSIKGNKMLIDIYAGIDRIKLGALNNLILPTTSHETTHWMKAKSPTLYRKYGEYVFKTLTMDGETEREVLDKRKRKMQAAHPNVEYTDAEVRDEVIARASEDMFANSAKVKEFLNTLTENEKKSFVDKVKEILQSIKDWLDDFLSKNKSTEDEAKQIRNHKERIDEQIRLWDEMLANSIEVNQALKKEGITGEELAKKVSGKEKTSTESGEVQYSDRPFEEQVDDVLAGTFDRTNAVYVGMTPKILQDVGLNGELPMLTTASHIRNANKPKNDKKHHHGLTEEQIKSIPQKIANPVMIMDSLDATSNSIVVVTDMIDTDNSPVIVTIKADGKGMYNNVEIDTNFLTSYYGKDGFANFIGKNVAADSFLYINKEKAITLSTESSTQWLEQLKNYDFNTIIRKHKEKSQEKFSDRDNSDYSRITEMQTELNQIRATIREMEASEEFKAEMDKLSEAVNGDNAVEGVEAYNQWKQDSGYGELITRKDTLQVELENLQKEFTENSKSKALKEEQEAIAKSGLSEADYFRKQAVKEFGYTPYFYDAGYITPNGKMLNFSGEKGQHFGSRGQDHRAIGIIYADDTQGTDALNRFMRDGNIRIMPESPSIDISTLVEPTTEQYSTIRKFIYEYAAKEYFAIDLTDESGKVIGSLEYENKINPTRIINDIKQYFATGEIREQSDIDKYRYSDRDSIDTEINQSMTMEEAKQMIQRAFVLGGIQEFYENEYKNGDEWLNGEGVDEVALYIENEYTLTEKYLNKIEGMYNGDFYVEDILKAYLNGTLTGKEKPKAKRLDIKKEYRVNDTRFYSPKRIKDVKKLFSVASQRLTDSNRAEVTKARAKILLFAHNEGASELLGLTQAELNKKLRAWSGYPAGARETSKRFNQGVADSNKWTGIENCSWLSKSTVTTEELESLVNSIEGAANNYEKLYIARTMLALDTHIDWSWLSFEFDSKAGVNAKHNGSGNVLGFYRNDARKIVVSHNLPNTVAHEMGHALDYQWGRDLGFTNSTMTDAYRNTELITDAESKQFFDNFKIFMDSLTDNGDISSEYLQDPKEVFARFVAKFIEWVDNTATGNRYYRTESSYYNDKFTASNYIEFVRLLQEKAMLDSRKMASENVEDVQYSDRDTEGNSLTKEQQDFFANSKVRDENGNLRVMWHGTDSNFTVFDIEKAGSNWGKDSRLGKGFYFANTKEDALKWTKGKTTIKAYLNLTNPLDLTATTPKNIVEEIDKYIDKLYASYDEKTYFITKEQYQNNLQRIKEMYLKDASMFIDLFKYDDNGNMTDGIREFLSALGYDGIVSKDETVAFYPEQIKDVENKNPTSNPDIQYSDRDTLSISNDEYSKLLSKKPIKATKKEMAKVGQQRIRRYANMTEDDVPNIDYFRLADYNKVNVAYLYTIRNVGKDYFSVVKKEVIKPQTIPRGINKSIQEAETNGRNDTNNARISQGISEVRTEGTHNSFSVYRSNNGRRGTVGNKLQENDKVVTSDGQSNNERYNGEDLSNTRREQRGDLKFSDRDNVSVYDVMGQTKALKKENELLKADVERLKERLALERKVTHGNYFEPKQLEAAAKHIRHLANSNIDIKTLMTYFDGVYSYIAHSPDLNWQDMFAQCYDVASMVLDEAKPITVSNDYAKMILRDIRSAKISVSEAQKGDARYKLGNKWHGKFFGKITITDSGISLDSQWKEWASAYPDIFDAEISEAQQLAELYDIIESLKETSEMVVEYDVEERTRWLAREIYNQYWNVSPIRTTADKYDKQIKLLNFKHRQMMKELRDGYEDRLTKQKQADRTYYRDLIRNIRERKDAEIKEVRELGKKRMSEYKERVERNTLIQSITAQSLTLNRWLTKNSKDEHIHEALKGPVINLLQAIDFSSKQLLGMKGTVKDRRGTPTQKDISLQNALTQVQSMMGRASVGEATLVELYGHGLDDEIASLVTSVNEMMRTVGDNEFILNQMSIEELKTLSKIVGTIKASVTKMNKFHTVNHTKGIAALAQEQIAYADSLGNLKVANPETWKGKIQKLTKWDNAVPYYAFKRFGTAGKKIFEAFQDGWDKLAFHAKEIIDFTEKTYTDKEIKEWSKDIKSFKVLVPTTEALSGDPSYKPQYDNIQMTVPQIMSLYCSMKREQARKHIFGGGIKVADIVSDKKDIISQNDNVQLTESDVKNIISTLTDRQKQVADALQEFMNIVCAKWGNEISMARFGYLAFGEENYFPIQVDKDNLNDAGENGEDIKPPNTSLFALLNMSFTKTANDNANNALVLNDIFDVFAQHSSDMAKYNALALPVLDAFRWYNYSEKNYINDKQYKTKSVKKSIKNAYGEQGKRYIKTFLQDINGQQNVSRDTLGKGFFTNAKLASVALNLRVALLQPTAYLKAGAVMKNKYLIKGLLHKSKIDRAEKYCGMALWKSLGYYDTDISKGLTEKIKHSETLKDKAIEVSMKGAEWGDKLTFGYLWNACELEIRDTRKDLKVGSDEFNNAIGKRLREVIYATQVVDSTMTRSQIMRSGNMYEKMLTAFSSEPTLAYNMLQDVWVQGSLEKRANGKVSKETAKKTVKVLTAYTVTNIVAALVESGFDALRDDDDEEMDVAKFMQYYLANFGQDMSIMAKIPYLKEIVSVAQGFTSSRSDTQWMESFSNSIKGVWKLSQGEGNPTSVFKNILRTISYFSGLPFYNAYRDFMAALNKLEILTAEDLEELFGDFFD